MFKLYIDTMRNVRYNIDEVINMGAYYSEAQNKATQRYNAKTYDRLAIRVKKGEAEKIKTHAESKGMSLNGYINALIEADMKQGIL